MTVILTPVSRATPSRPRTCHGIRGPFAELALFAAASSGDELAQSRFPSVAVDMVESLHRVDKNAILKSKNAGDNIVFFIDIREKTSITRPLKFSYARRKTFQNAEQHQKAVHEGRKDYACDRCENKFGEKYKLIRHQLTVHERGKDFECEKWRAKKIWTKTNYDSAPKETVHH
ncbi:unnamed protein product, partial [Trichogramma brassicae]